jgi:hypothetical protein
MHSYPPELHLYAIEGEPGHGTVIRRDAARGGMAEWIGFAPLFLCGPDSVLPAVAADLPQTTPACALLFPWVVEPPDEVEIQLDAVIRGFPAPIRFLLDPPTTRYFVVARRDAILAGDGLREVGATFFDWQMRLAGGRHAMEVRSSSPIAIPLDSYIWCRDLPRLEFRDVSPRDKWLIEPILQIAADDSSIPRKRAIAIRAGLLQRYDFFEEAHDLAQSIEGDPVADYWHAIMHRREPDPSNARYWYRHVGRHAIFKPLAELAAKILEGETDLGALWKSKLIPNGKWDPIAFIGLCEKYRGEIYIARDRAGFRMQTAARRIQWAEMLLLLKWSLGQAL